jgi:hypothetical protein
MDTVCLDDGDANDGDRTSDEATDAPMGTSNQLGMSLDSFFVRPI